MFFKTLKLFLLLFAVSAVAAWVAENPGRVVVEWLGYRITTSVPFSILLMAAALWIIGWILRLLRFALRPLSDKGKKSRDELPFV